jgi:hypothetical protein
MFSATNAAFEGLRLAGRHPFLMLFWAVAYVLAILVLVAMAFFIVAPPGVWPALLAGNPDGIEADAFSPLRFAVVFPLAFGAVLLTTAMVNTAVYRAVLRPRERGLGYLAIGGDEGRQVLLSLLIMLVAILVGAGLVGLTMVVIALTPEPYNVLAGVLTGIAAVAAMIWVSTRLSLAAVQTFIERRVTLFGSWRLTRGRFWPLLGMWLLVVALTIVVSLLATAISYLPMLFTGVPLPSFELHDLTQARAFPGGTAAIVAIVLQGLIQMVGGVIQVAIGVAPAAAAYSQIKGPAA